MKVFDCECTQPPKIGEPLHTLATMHTQCYNVRVLNGIYTICSTFNLVLMTISTN